MTQPDHLELKEAAKCATPGPWEYDWVDYEGYDNPQQFVITTSDIGDGYEICDTINRGHRLIDTEDDRGEGPDGPEGAIWDEQGRKDAHFIALANPSKILELLAENEALRGELSYNSDKSSEQLAKLGVRLSRMIPVGESDPQYYLGAIMRRLQEFQKIVDAGPHSYGLGDEALADEIDWLDCFMDAEKRKRLSLYEENERLQAETIKNREDADSALSENASLREQLREMREKIQTTKDDADGWQISRATGHPETEQIYAQRMLDAINDAARALTEKQS